MTPSTPLAYAEQRMQQRWYDLVMADQKGAATPELEHLYNAYLRAVADYNRLVADPHTPVVAPQQQPAGKVLTSRYKRKAS